jgi:CHAD domain-containing protein
MARPLKIKKISPDTPMKRAGRRILRTRLKEFYSHWSDPDQIPTAEQLHNLRISGKRLRYSAESLREFYPDRLSLLIDLLKRSQDLLGEIQDCFSQQSMVEEDLRRLRRRDPESRDCAVLESISLNYDRRRESLFQQFHEIWRGMTQQDFRHGFKMMVRKPTTHQPEPADFSLYLINPS